MSVKGFFRFVLRLIWRTFVLLWWLLPLTIIGVLALWLWLPVGVNDYVFPLVIERFGLQNCSARVQDIGIFSTGFGPIVIGSRRADPIRVENLRIRYSPWAVVSDLWEGNPIPVEGIDISGVSLSATISDSGVFTLDTTEWERLVALIPHSGGAPKTKTAVPVSLQSIRMTNTLLRLKYKERLYWTSAEVIVRSPDSNILLSQRLRGKVMAQENVLKFEIEPRRDGGWDITFSGSGNLGDLRSLIPENLAVRLGGTAAGSGTVSFVSSHSKMTVGAFQASGSVKGLFANLRENNKTVFAMRQLPDSPLVFSVSRRPGKALKVSAGPLRTTNPVQSVSFFNLSIDAVDSAPGIYQMTAGMESDLNGKIKLLPDLKLGKGISVKSHLSGITGLNGEGRLNLSSSIEFRSPAEFLPVSLDVPAPIQMLGEVVYGGKTPLAWSLNGVCDSTLTVKTDSATASLNDFHFWAGNDSAPLRGEVGFGINADGPLGLEAVLSDLKIAGSLGSDGAWRGSLRLQGVNVTHPDAQISDLSAEFPLVWPYRPEMPPPAGSIQIPSITVMGEEVGSMDAQVIQKDKIFQLNGNFHTWAIQHLQAGFEIQAGSFSAPGLQDRFGAKLRFDIPEQRIPDTTCFGSYLPILEGFEGGGKFSFSGAYAYGFPEESPWASVRLTEGTLCNKAMKLAINGIDLSLRAEEGLRSWRTESGQSLQIESLAMGALKVNDLGTRFRLEENGDILVEGVAFDFAGGEVRSLSMRVVPGSNAYRILLYCDRLLLREIFKQVNLGDSVSLEGDARISGLVPVDIDGSNIRLGKGYLYTTPGEKGTMKLKTGQKMLGSLTPEQPGYGQIELSRLALAHFNYDWIKLNLSMVQDSGSQGENDPEMYMIQLSFFGKPAAPLPFVYNPQDGSFVKMSGAMTGQGIMQEMQLDMNLKSDVKLLTIAFGLTRFMEELEKSVKDPFKKKLKKGIPLQLE